MDRPTWAITASPYTPAALLANLAENLAHGTGTRQNRPHYGERQTSRISATPLPTPPPHPARVRSPR
ncbi:DUF317 domain-containing protein [Streptomyces sp. NPDC048417]|uniref:DUF317 domain-containing protein n=1 Tax=Streptomyces sp. NPDC048417 TaxID=3155387 RepID=UPI00342EFE68